MYVCICIGRYRERERERVFFLTKYPLYFSFTPPFNNINKPPVGSLFFPINSFRALYSIFFHSFLLTIYLSIFPPVCLFSAHLFLSVSHMYYLSLILPLTCPLLPSNLLYICLSFFFIILSLLSQSIFLSNPFLFYSQLDFRFFFSLLFSISLSNFLTVIFGKRGVESHNSWPPTESLYY